MPPHRIFYKRLPAVLVCTVACCMCRITSTVDLNAINDEQDSIFLATGFTGGGLMHSPAAGLAVSEMVTGAPLSFDLSAYGLNRASNREKYVI